MKSWHVIYTKARAEKKVEERLNNLGIKAYCPVKEEIKQWTDRKKKILVPLLPSMVLVNLEEKERNTVFEISGVIRYMFWLGKHAIVKDFEVEFLRSLLSKNNIISQKTMTLKVGENINVPGLENQTGIIKKISNNQIWVVLKKLGYVIKLKIT
jgi:transcriptional antiterminator RfaH